MDIPTYESFMKAYDAKGQNIITKLVLKAPGSNSITLNNELTNGDIDVNKLNFSTLDTLIVKSPNGFSQDITTNATYTSITGAYIKNKSTRKALIQLHVGLSFQVTAGEANVTIILLVDGVARQVKIAEYGKANALNVGFLSTRQINDLLQLPIGQHTIQVQARFDLLNATSPTLNISNFYMTYLPYGN